LFYLNFLCLTGQSETKNRLIVLTDIDADADGSSDPDGDALSYLRFQYQEAGTYKGNVSFDMLAENLCNVHTIKAPQG
jgi:hypothetical protein